MGFPSGSDIKILPAKRETRVRLLGWEESPGGWHDKPLQYPSLGNSMDRGAWWATVHMVTKSRIQLSD